MRWVKCNARFCAKGEYLAQNFEYEFRELERQQPWQLPQLFSLPASCQSERWHCRI
jgi:hypothetical protein